jgi:hypothetical protein
MIMVNDEFYELIGLPDRLTPINRKIDKKMFFEQMEYSSKEKQQFTQWIDRITMAYLLAPQNINIHPYVDEDKKYENVTFITVSLKKELTMKQVKQVAGLLHESLPNPTVFCFTSEEKILLCTALKRLNKNNLSKVIVEELKISPWLGLQNNDDTTVKFFKSIHISSLSFTTFYNFYSDFHYALRLLEVAENTGEFVSYEEEELNKVTMLLEQISVLEMEIDRYRKLMNKESQFNKKVEYNIKVQELKQQCKTIKRELNL